MAEHASNPFRPSIVVLSILLWMAAANAAQSQGLQVTSFSPASQAKTTPPTADIVIDFDKPLQTASIVPLQSFWAFGRWSGTVQGSISFSNGDRTVTLSPNKPFAAGESVMVILSEDIAATDASTIRPGGFSFQFWVRTTPTETLDLAEVDRLSTRDDPEVPVRSYGGSATDLDGDGFVDITITNEVSADLRVFMNDATGSGLYDPFLQPTFPTEVGSSANEPSDFNRDGFADLCTANIDSNSVSVFLGNGDGTFAAAQVIEVGFTPLGIAVLDVDGDGDIDIVNTNRDSDNLSLLVNDGSGVFANPIFFEGGDLQERALAAGDMNDDGLLDLVVGFRDGFSLVVNLGNGDGTFTPGTPLFVDSQAWMLVLGDVDGNGTVDVASANARDNEGIIVLGDGAGNLGPAIQQQVAAGFPIATDLGDMDGDGDLDWLLSNFSGSWVLYLNDGAANFSEFTSVPPSLAASCALMADQDNDGDLDLALIDEVEDEIVMVHNVPEPGSYELAVAGLVALALLAQRKHVRRPFAGAAR